jgi:glycosyltransferase involved in cell wall biosynthesis
MAPTVDILLATYNGEKYLREQLDSILWQNHRDWRLIIRDDCSHDGTLAIINEFRAQNPDKILLLDVNGTNLGVVRNFSHLLDNATADYVMFCDQDDVWLPHKISVTLDKMHELEKAPGLREALLVFTDLTVVAEDGDTVLADSVWNYQQLDPGNVTHLNRLLLQNIPTGCTVMINRALRDKAAPIPADAAMHDWWLTLVAAVFGSIGYLPEATIRYRQHGKNVCGVTRWSLLNDLTNFLSPAFRKELTIIRKEKLRSYRLQAAAFIERYSTELPVKNRTMVKTFAQLDGFCQLRQKYYILKFRFFYSNSFVTAAMVLFRW